MGINIPVTACDDAHRYIGDECRSFIMVQAEDLSRNSIIEAIRQKRFYASQGPWVHTELNGRSLKINCTPVMEIKVFTNKNGGFRRVGKGTITGAVFQLPDTDYYYRVEVIDKDGNMAWTSPVKVE